MSAFTTSPPVQSKKAGAAPEAPAQPEAESAPLQLHEEAAPGGGSPVQLQAVMGHWAGDPVQRKEDGDAVQKEEKAEAPSAGQVGSATIHALQSHMKLTSKRMYAVAANIHTILGQPSNTEAGVEPTMQALQQQYDLVMDDMGRLHSEVSRVPDLMRGAMSVELGMLRGAWYDGNGLNRALSSVYSFTHDKDGRARTDASSYTGTITDVQNQLKSIYSALHVDEGEITNRYMARGGDVAAELGEATSEALDAGIAAMQTCVRRLRADLDSMDDKDAEITASDLMAVVSEAASAPKGITAKNMGAVKGVVKDVEAFQAELAKRSGPKIERLAKRIGYNSSVSSNLHTLNLRLAQVAKEGKHR